MTTVRIVSLRALVTGKVGAHQTPREGSDDDNNRSTDMAGTNRSIWDSLDKALTVTLKVLALGLVLLVVLVLSFCSDETVKQSSTWTLGRLELVGLRPTKLSLLGVEFQTAATAAAGMEASNAKGLAADLRTLSEDTRIPPDIRQRLSGLGVQVGNYAQQLSDRDKKVVAAIKSASRAPAPDAKPVTGWIYLGRRSSYGAWAPRSDKISLEGESELKIERDLVLIDKAPTASSGSDATAGEERAETIRLVRAGGPKLKILETRDSPSIGDGKFQWAKVEVSPSDLYEVRRGDAP